MNDSRDDGNQLLDAVDALTKPYERKESKDILEGGKVIGQERVTVKFDPLLTQLDAAIRSDLGGTAAGASLAHESSLLDVDALFIFMKIATQIKDWCRMLKVAPTGDPAADLRAWYVARDAKGIDADTELFHIKILGRWAAQITGKLDPWREKDLPDACPLCGAEVWFNRADGKPYPRPLVVRYKPTGPDLVQDARGMCKACGEVWSVRALAYDIEQAEAAKGDVA